jgi:hypothetical protein
MKVLAAFSAELDHKVNKMTLNAWAINPATKYIIDCHSGERRNPSGNVDAGSSPA